MIAYPVLSLCPEEAIGFLSRLYSTLVVCNPPAFLRNYRGRILLHSLPFPDEPTLQSLCLDFMAAYGFDQSTFPGLAIQGLATVAEVFVYDADRFVQDQDFHGCGPSLGLHQATHSSLEEVWGIRLTETYFLECPVVDIFPPAPMGHGQCWIPQTASQLKGVEQALMEDEMHRPSLGTGYNGSELGLWLRWIEQAPPKR